MAIAREDGHKRLATCGTLAPGRINHHQLSSLEGRWIEGRVHGNLVESGWGAKHGCPGIVLDPQGTAVDVFIFESEYLPGHWERLDAFEGDEYRRSLTEVKTGQGVIVASIYVLAE